MKSRMTAVGSPAARFEQFGKVVAAALCCLGVICMTASAVQAQDDISDFVVYGKSAVTYQGFTDSIGAPVGTNGNLNHLAGIGTFTALHGGGVLNGANTNARQRVDGDLIFNGDVNINDLRIA